VQGGAVTEETAVSRPEIGALLRDLDQVPPSELVDVCADWLARRVSAQACVLLLADYAVLRDARRGHGGDIRGGHADRDKSGIGSAVDVHGVGVMCTLTRG
jgi:hypothetical protein